jgi:hypothetical protein
MKRGNRNLSKQRDGNSRIKSKMLGDRMKNVLLYTLGSALLAMVAVGNNLAEAAALLLAITSGVCAAEAALRHSKNALKRHAIATI